ncbi:hypothetical protein WR25_04736 isoform B [Diploscapter pachys]|uniref:Protein kinase domain-containing protein n=1 Tax=Diploscapter pachys TaxID=2018661 RepID=A0A2A2L6N2_9BILA|nr:hypothetical protein WR25_04736 isoform A [Diploscapter pachys]PAV81708.1 hypothetical protein WR25_04736 isoform B [Diploscapter pachys]
MVEGTLPFTGSTTEEIREKIRSHDVPTPVQMSSYHGKELLERLLAKNPAKRIILRLAHQHPFVYGAGVAKDQASISDSSFDEVEAVRGSPTGSAASRSKRSRGEDSSASLQPPLRRSKRRAVEEIANVSDSISYGVENSAGTAPRRKVEDDSNAQSKSGIHSAPKSQTIQNVANTNDSAVQVSENEAAQAYVRVCVLLCGGK